MLKLFLSPIRLMVGWGLYPRLLGGLGIAMLVLLRLSIGWHFYSEGLDKYRTPGWDAAPFFANAKGPYADSYRQLVWDWDGSIRLNQEATIQWWANYRERVSDHYGFDAKQKQQAAANYAKAIEQLEWVIAENATDIEEFNLGRTRVAELELDPVRTGVESLGGQRETIRREWNQKVAGPLKQIDKVWENYEIAQNAVATREQADAKSPLAIGRPRVARMDTTVINQIVPYFDMAIGICLLLGLFTPVAALAAAGFLGSVFLSQYPPGTGPTSSNYQLIECMACLVLASMGAGRFAGLDFFLHLIIRSVWARDAREE